MEGAAAANVVALDHADADDDGPRWCTAEEEYLQELAAVCRRLAQAYLVVYHTYRTRQKRVRVPMIAISSASGMLSFGTEVFPSDWHKYINICVGIAGLLVALVGSIESFLRLTDTIANSATASLNLEKLAETICLELSLPIHRRNASGTSFVRASYGAYEKIMESAPNVLKRVVFLRPSWAQRQKRAPHQRRTNDVQDLLFVPAPDDPTPPSPRATQIDAIPVPQHNAVEVPAAHQQQSHAVPAASTHEHMMLPGMVPSPHGYHSYWTERSAAFRPPSRMIGDVRRALSRWSTAMGVLPTRRPTEEDEDGVQGEPEDEEDDEERQKPVPFT
jgi:hypothetical protein